MGGETPIWRRLIEVSRWGGCGVNMQVPVEGAGVLAVKVLVQYYNVFPRILRTRFSIPFFQFDPGTITTDSNCVCSRDLLRLNPHEKSFKLSLGLILLGVVQLRVPMPDGSGVGMFRGRWESAKFDFSRCFRIEGDDPGTLFKPRSSETIVSP